MIQLTVGSATDSRTTLVAPSDKILDICNANGLDTSKHIHLNGRPLSNTELGKTLEEMGIRESARLIQVVKADSGI